MSDRHIDPEFIESIKSMVKSQMVSPMDKGTVWRVVTSTTNTADNTQQIVAELYLDRRDGVSNRQEAIDYVIKNFKVLTEDYKIEAFEE